jgi:hypothetical protein
LLVHIDAVTDPEVPEKSHLRYNVRQVLVPKEAALEAAIKKQADEKAKNKQKS